MSAAKYTPFSNKTFTPYDAVSDCTGTTSVHLSKKRWIVLYESILPDRLKGNEFRSTFVAAAHIRCCGGWVY